MSYKDGGYYPKYKVIRAATGDEITEKTFTLLPECDPHARKAVLAYAKSVTDENPELANDLKEQFSV